MAQSPPSKPLGHVDGGLQSCLLPGSLANPLVSHHLPVPTDSASQIPARMLIPFVLLKMLSAGNKKTSLCG